MTRLEEASHDVAEYISTLSENGMTKVMCAISYPYKCCFVNGEITKKCA